MPFTPEELEELARFDAEIDAEFERVSETATTKKLWYLCNKDRVRQNKIREGDRNERDPENILRNTLLIRRKECGKMSWGDVARILGTTERRVAYMGSKRKKIDLSFFEPAFPGLVAEYEIRRKYIDKE